MIYVVQIVIYLSNVCSLSIASAHFRITRASRGPVNDLCTVDRDLSVGCMPIFHTPRSLHMGTASVGPVNG